MLSSFFVIILAVFHTGTPTVSRSNGGGNEITVMGRFKTDYYLLINQNKSMSGLFKVTRSSTQKQV